MNKINFFNVQLGAAPIGWSNDDLLEIGKDTTFEQIISEMALIGYLGTEIGRKYPKDPTVLNHALKIRNLQAISAWFSSYLLTQPYEEVLNSFKNHVAFLKSVNSKLVVVSEQSFSIQKENVALFNKKPTISDAQFKELGKKLNLLGQYAKSQGLELVFHHHMGTIIQTAQETKKLLANTDPDKVSLLFDTGHFAMANEDVAPLILEFKDRIKHVHLKDVRANIVNQMKQNNTCFLEGIVSGMFTVPGDGFLDFKTIFTNLAKINYQGWMVVEAEQDPLKANPFEYHLQAMKFIKSLINFNK